MTIGRNWIRCERCCSSRLARSNSERKSEPFDLGLAITEETIGDQTNFPGRRIEAKLVSPGSQCFQDVRLPCLQLDVRNCGKTRIQHTLEIKDLFKVPRLQPWSQRLFTHVE